MVWVGYAGLRRKIAGKTPEEIKAFSASVPPVSMQDLLEAIGRISPSVAKVSGEILRCTGMTMSAIVCRDRMMH